MKENLLLLGDLSELSNMIYKHMTAVSKNVYIDKLADIVAKYNNKYHKKIKIKSVDVKSGTHIGYGVEHNNKGPKFKVGDHVRISKYNNILAKDYIGNCSEEVLGIEKVKSTAPWSYFISDLNSG